MGRYHEEDRRRRHLTIVLLELRNEGVGSE